MQTLLRQRNEDSDSTIGPSPAVRRGFSHPIPCFLAKQPLWSVALFMIDTACTLWLRHEPYSPVWTLGYSLFVAFVFALPDHLFDLFAGRSRGANETSHV